MPSNTGRCSFGVVRTHPVIIGIVSLKLTFSLLVCMLRHPAGAAYSTALYTTASALVRRVGDFAPHDVLTRHLSKLSRADILTRNFSRCCRIVSCLSNFTHRYLSWLFYGCRDSVEKMFSCLFASRLFK